MEWGCWFRISSLSLLISDYGRHVGRHVDSQEGQMEMVYRSLTWPRQLLYNSIVGLCFDCAEGYGLCKRQGGTYAKSDLVQDSVASVVIHLQSWSATLVTRKEVELLSKQNLRQASQKSYRFIFQTHIWGRGERVNETEDEKILSKCGCVDSSSYILVS